MHHRADRRPRPALALALALLAWVAQLCLPVAHAGLMAAPGAPMPGWCGEPSRMVAAAADLPAEIREGLGLDDDAAADHLLACAALCAAASTSPPPAAASFAALAGWVDSSPAPVVRPAPRARKQAPTPPSHGPPSAA